MSVGCGSTPKTKKIEAKYLFKTWRMGEVKIGQQYDQINPFLTLTFSEEGKWIRREKSQTQEGTWEIDEYKALLTLEHQQQYQVKTLNDTLLTLIHKTPKGGVLTVSYVPDKTQNFEFLKKLK